MDGIEMRKILIFVAVCALLFASCGPETKSKPPESEVAKTQSTPLITPTPIPTDTPTPAPTFPAIGEWLDNVPYSLTNDDFALVLDIQQVNSTTNVASLTSIVGECVYDHIDQNSNAVNRSQPYTYAASAGDTINGSDISLTANVAYFSTGNGIKTIYGMTFAGTINSDGAILLASSELNGVQDYTFEPATGAVAKVQNAFQQAQCS